ncbi:ferredoxin reductase [Pseudonocardia bannensis]|uniref:Ferredoxin reductase n=1 Tax=Pseudonocardia bannensis TaxID=630973 RepID=A0A848DJJ6_9PSEU|nr:ferredoxin reductase [Pseudonocardia bannensis]NMH92877.1 ferredoxin reductase [Pseudonocardia bannensis]
MGTFGRRVQTAVGWFTTPLLPTDFLGTLNPMWSTREPRARVVGLRRETADTTTLLLRPGAGPVAHRPGQFIGLGVQVAGVWHWRTYSITSRPGGELLEVTVTAVPGGAVSPVLAHGTPVGTVLRLAPPAGEFVLPEPTPEKLLFVTAGSGITPVMGMLRELAATNPRALAGSVLVHCDRTPADLVFGLELRALAASTGLRLVERHTAREGRLTPDALTDEVPDWAARQTWACGPGGLLDDLAAHWDRAGDVGALHIERFRPPTPVDGEGTGGRVRFTSSAVETDAGPDTPVLVAGEAAGALLPNGCRMGICHTCVGRLRTGAVRNLHTGEVHDTPGEPVRTCVSAAAGDVEIEL